MNNINTRREGGMMMSPTNTTSHLITPVFFPFHHVPCVRHDIIFQELIACFCSLLASGIVT